MPVCTAGGLDMKKSLYVKRFFFSIIISAFIICLFPLSAMAADNNDGVVKVGVLNNSSYAYQDDNGVWRGSDVECMIDIAQKAGFKVEFVDSTTDVDLFEHLNDGTYDILADMAKGPDFMDNYLFTDETIGTAYSTLAVRADDSRWDYGDVDQISRMKIGVIGLYQTNSDFRSWCTEHNVSPKIVEYSDITTMSAALESGEIDGELYLAEDGAEYVEKFHTILKFLPEPIYFMFRKNDIELKNSVDSALSQILSGNTNYLVDLKNKYETQFNGGVLPLSSVENDYIQENPTASVAVVSNDAPYYKQNSDGTDGGIIPDYYTLITKWSGLKFKYDVYDTYEDAVSAVADGKSDIFGAFSDGLIAASQSGLSLTDSISNVNCILLARPDTNTSDIKNLAIPNKMIDSVKINIDRLFPNSEIKGYKSARDSFNAVKYGQADASILGLPGVTWLINQTNSTSYSIIPVPNLTYDICAAVDADNQTLCNIMNKSIAATKGSFTGITTKDTIPENDLQTTISRIPPVLVILVILILIFLVVGLIWAMVLLRRRQRERTAILQTKYESEQQRIRAEATEKSAEEKNVFFSNISHDMRTPLNAITGFIRMAKKSDLPVETRNEYLEKADQSCALLIALVDDTLTISKANSGKLKIQPEPVRLRELIDSIIFPIQAAAKKKNITFTVDYSKTLDRAIMADKLSVQKIFLNLLTNAVKYTPDGGNVHLDIFNSSVNGNHPDSVIVVSDDGIGMSDEFLPHIFEPFAQEKQRGYESVGTGLGLSIVKKLVDMMGGTINVESEKGKGTTFTVRLFFENAENAETWDTLSKPVSNIDLSGKKVLLCEDNALNREIAIAIIREKGIVAVTAEDGEIGVRKFSESAAGEFDAILMDIRMPVMDGYEATRQIRAMNRSDAETVPIIAMTADAFEDDIQKCLHAGMNGHIAKPIDPELLNRELSKVFAL